MKLPQAGKSGKATDVPWCVTGGLALRLSKSVSFSLFTAGAMGPDWRGFEQSLGRFIVSFEVDAAGLNGD